jgi:hypothetical protein
MSCKPNLPTEIFQKALLLNQAPFSYKSIYANGISYADIFYIWARKYWAKNQNCLLITIPYLYRIKHAWLCLTGKAVALNIPTLEQVNQTIKKYEGIL